MHATQRTRLPAFALVGPLLLVVALYRLLWSLASMEETLVSPSLAKDSGAGELKLSPALAAQSAARAAIPCASKDFILSRYESKRKGISDIHGHMPYLRALGNNVSSVLDIGVRFVVSSWAFAAAAVDRADRGLATRYVGADLRRLQQVDKLLDALKNCTAVVNPQFIEGDDLLMAYPRSDLVFIDTWHAYKQLIRELEVLSPFAERYIVLHDTTSFATTDERLSGHGGKPVNVSLFAGVQANKAGLWTAVQDFLALDARWVVKQRFTHNNGLTVLERVSV